MNSEYHAVRLFRRFGLIGDIEEPEREPRLRAAQRGQRALVHVQALAVAAGGSISPVYALIESVLAAAGAIIADVWADGVTMPVIDSLGDEFYEEYMDTMRESGMWKSFFENTGK